MSQRDEATQGLERIPFIVHRYQVIERMRRRHTGFSVRHTEADTDILVTDLENKVIQLYTKIIEYQIRLMRQSFHGWALRYGRDVFKADDWKTILSQIEKLDTECSRLAGELGQEEVETGMRENGVKIDNLLQSWKVDLRSLQEQGTKISTMVDSHARESLSWREKEERQKLLQALRAKNPYRDQMGRTPSRQPGTCNWFLKHPQFQSWREDPHSRLLWVSANPGCGKSVLSKCLIEERLATLNPEHTTICYFFFKDISPESRSIGKAISAVLHQLFTKIPSLIDLALPAFDENGDELASMFGTLWEILENAATDIRSGEVVCVLDALDECEEAEQIIFIEKLKTFYSKAEDKRYRKQKLRFLLTSRPYRTIRAKFHSLIQEFPTIHLSGDDESDLIREEIDLVIRSEVSTIASERHFSSETEEFLRNQLLSIENRTYLWLHLILDQIRNSDNAGNEKAIRKEIKTIPQSVSKAYEAILAKAKDKKLATKLLHIIVGAETALTLQELNVAMSIDDDSTCYKDLQLEDATVFDIRIRSICGLFVYTDRSKVFLIHQSAKDFLRQDPGLSEPAVGMWEHSLRPEDSHSLLADICVRLLMFHEFETDPLLVKGLDEAKTTEEYEQYCDAHVLLGYAARWWSEHLNSSRSEQQNAMVQKATHLCNLRSRRCWTWLGVKRFAEDDYQPLGFTNLILASELELISLARHLLADGVDVNAKDKEGASALNRAVDTGNREMVELLLDHGADIEASHWDTPWREEIGDDGSTREVKAFSGPPLALATINEDHDMMRMLLSAGARQETWRLDSSVPLRTPLHWAALQAEDLLTMRILLENGVNVNARTEKGRERHAFLSEEETARDRQILKNHIFEGNIERLQSTALQLSVWQDNAAKVGLLLNYGAAPEEEIFLSDGDHEVEAVSIKSNNSSESIPKSGSPNNEQISHQGPVVEEDFDQFLTLGSDEVEVSENEDCSRDQLISKVSEEEAKSSRQAQSGRIADEESSTQKVFVGSKVPLAQILEEREQLVNNISKITTFHIAVDRGVEDVVNLLMQHGACQKPYPATPSEPTALHLAALGGVGPVVKMLLDRAANVDPKDLNGETPLHLAVWCGYDSVVNEFLEHGANVNSKDSAGTTPLHVAVRMGYDLLINDLLGYGADLHAENDVGYSPLLIAALNGYEQAIKEFVHYKANLNRGNVDGTTACHAAAQRGHDMVVRQLLIHGADPNVKDKKGVSPLHLAAKEGHYEAVNELLEFHAELDARTLHGRTPLHLAAEERHSHVVKQLLDHNADFWCETKQGHTALDLARIHNAQEVVTLLLERYPRGSNERRLSNASSTTVSRTRSGSESS